MKKLLGILVLGLLWCNAVVADKFQMSYKDIDDDKFDEVVQYIEFLKKNPS